MSAVGIVPSCTLNCAVPPFSVVTRPVVGVTRMVAATTVTFTELVTVSPPASAIVTWKV